MGLPLAALGYLCLASRDSGCLLAFQGILSGGVSARLAQSGEQARLTFDLSCRAALAGRRSAIGRGWMF